MSISISIMNKLDEFMKNTQPNNEEKEKFCKCMKQAINYKARIESKMCTIQKRKFEDKNTNEAIKYLEKKFNSEHAYSHILKEILNKLNSEDNKDNNLIELKKIFCNSENFNNINTEKNRIDILIECKEKKFFIIENKIWNEDDENQLKNYIDKYKDKEIIVIYLTLDGYPPSEKSLGIENEGYRYIGKNKYNNIKKDLENGYYEACLVNRKDKTKLIEIRLVSWNTIYKLLKEMKEYSNNDKEYYENLIKPFIEQLAKVLIEPKIFMILSENEEYLEYVKNEYKKDECKRKYFNRIMNTTMGKPEKKYEILEKFYF